MQVDPQLRTTQHTARPLLDSLRQNLAQLRATLVQLKGQDPVPLDQLHSLLQQLVLLAPNIEQYVGILRESVQLVQERRSKESVFAISLEGLGQREGICLYLWQLFNFLCIHGLELPPQLECLVLPLLKVEVQFQNVHSPNSLKNALIFIYNSMSKGVKEIKEGNGEEVKEVKAKEIKANESSCLLKMVSLIIMNNFQRGQKVSPQLLELFPVVKTEEHFVSEMEWVGYISMLLFSNEANKVREGSLVQQLVEVSGSGRMFYYCLHLMGSYFENMVDNRVTTELVTGFECQIADVKEMYQKEAKNVTAVRISQRDLEYILECYKNHITEYRHIVREYLLLKLQKEENEDEENKEKEKKKEDYMNQDKKEKYQEKMRGILSRWTGNAEVLNETAHLLNSLLFIGGYNNPLQTVITMVLLGADSLLLLHLELSYLLYRNLQSSRFKTKLKMMVDMEIEVKAKLLAATSLQDYPAEEIEAKDLCLDKILAEGQLVLLLRLLTNLVHINHAAQVPFEKETKYMHIILSLTHDSAQQVTMKEWAIMFIRNVAEGSQALREEIGKTKLEMKVE